MDERKKKLLNTVLELFSEYGASFKMADVAREMKISKKTIYKDYGNKEEVIVMLVESILEGIEQQLHEIMKDETLTTVEKLIRVTCAFPDTKEIDYHKAILLKDVFPRPYKMFINYIEDNWQLNKQLFETAVKEGRIKNIDHETFRIIMLGITKQIIDMDSNDKEGLLYRCVSQVFEGFLQ
jgi:AcrR family transcriptional regulator